MKYLKIKWLVLIFFLSVNLLFLGCTNILHNGSNPDIQTKSLIILGSPYQGKSSLAVKTSDNKITLITTELGLIASTAVIHNNELSVLHSGDNTIHILDVSSLTTKKQLNLGDNNNPYDIVYFSNEIAYITNFLANTVSVVNINNLVSPVLETITLPAGNDLHPVSASNPTNAYPQAIYYESDLTKRIYVGLTNLDTNYLPAGPGILSVINPLTNQVESNIYFTGQNPQAIYLTKYFSNYLFVTLAGNFYSVTDGAIGVYDLSLKTITTEIPVAGSPTKLAIDEEGYGLTTEGYGLNLRSFSAKTFTAGSIITITVPASFSIQLSSSAWIPNIFLTSENKWYCVVADMSNGYLFEFNKNTGEVISAYNINAYPCKILEL